MSGLRLAYPGGSPGFPVKRTGRNENDRRQHGRVLWPDKRGLSQVGHPTQIEPSATAARDSATRSMARKMSGCRCVSA